MSVPASELFTGVVPDDAAFKANMRRPPARVTYVIYFTPRSSSTRLTDILSRTGKLGQANEAFNPNFLTNIARTWKVADLEHYIAVMQRRTAPAGVCGFEITAHQLSAVFPDEMDFLRHFGQAPCFWLIRRDIVAQAVSLAKMVETKVGHSAFSNKDAQARADAAFGYNAAAIKQWLLHIRAAEKASEEMFERHDMTPLRLCYEDIVQLSPRRIVDLVSHHIGVPPPPTAAESTHEKLGTARNDEFAARFRAEHAEFLRGIARERAPMLARIHDLSKPLPTAAEMAAAHRRRVRFRLKHARALQIGLAILRRTRGRLRSLVTGPR